MITLYEVYCEPLTEDGRTKGKERLEIFQEEKNAREFKEKWEAMWKFNKENRIHMKPCPMSHKEKLEINIITTAD